MHIYTPIAIEIYRKSLNLLFDSHPCDHPLKVIVKQADSKLKSGKSLLKYPQSKGALYRVGECVFEEIVFNSIPWKYPIPVSLNYYEGACERLFTIVELSGVASDAEVLNKAGSLAEYSSTLSFERIEQLFSEVVQMFLVSHEVLAERTKQAYALDFSRRFFNDRQLCEELAHLIVEVFFDEGSAQSTEYKNDYFSIIDYEPYRQYARSGRSYKLAWLVDSIIERDRFRCAICNEKLTKETVTVDHIVPLSVGGCSDPVNFQSLCSDCNNQKDSDLVSVKSSVPEYFSRFPVKHRGRSSTSRPNWVHQHSDTANH